MKQFICIFYLFFILIIPGFSHKAQKQTERIQTELITKKWSLCEELILQNDFSKNDVYSEYLMRLNEFFLEVENTNPNDSIIYYYPECVNLHDSFCNPTKELLSKIQNSTGKELLNDSDFVQLRLKITEGLKNWEILQKNLILLQLEQVYYSYKILFFIIIVSIFVALVFLILYLITSKNEKQNKIFTEQMLNAQETERERISNELHDTVCQDMRILQFIQEEIVEKTTDDTKEKIQEAIKLCKRISSDVRNTCYALTPSDLDEGILEAVISLCTLLKNKYNHEIILSIQEDIKQKLNSLSFSRDKNLHIYRIVQEILINSIKHAQAETLSVLIRNYDEDFFRIIISDDGKGFDIKQVSKKKNHFGLKNLYTRTTSIKGYISFNSEENSGTQVTVTIPYN